jgi:hypothetical protein
LQKRRQEVGGLTAAARSRRLIAVLFDGPEPGGFYKLRIASASLPQGEIKAIIGRMAQEKVVDFVAATQ